MWAAGCDLGQSYMLFVWPVTCPEPALSRWTNDRRGLAIEEDDLARVDGRLSGGLLVRARKCYAERPVFRQEANGAFGYTL